MSFRVSGLRIGLGAVRNQMLSNQNSCDIPHMGYSLNS